MDNTTAVTGWESVGVDCEVTEVYAPKLVETERMAVVPRVCVIDALIAEAWDHGKSGSFWLDFERACAAAGIVPTSADWHRADVLSSRFAFSRR